jgi:DNA N-6-adenine-methyltransferase Dam
VPSLCQPLRRLQLTRGTNRAFGCDVCATEGKALCSDFILKSKDGLKVPWYGVVWMNPPYSNLIPWCRKAYEYALAGGTVIALLPVFTDAPWFHVWVSHGKITLLRGKLSYIGRPGVAPFSSMIVEWNPKTMKRRKGASLDVVLDIGVCVGGMYKAG